jgi:hypothetical protein
MPQKNSTNLLTKTMQKALKSAPLTSTTIAAFHYNFRTSKYELANPDLFKPASSFPFNKIRLVSLHLTLRSVETSGTTSKPSRSPITVKSTNVNFP